VPDDERTRARGDAERLADWERRATPFVVAAAIVPLVVAFGDREGPVVTIVDLVSWAVFVADLVVHVRLRARYLRTGWGVFDLVVVVGTFPWYLIPGLGGTAVMGLLRLGRLVRLAVIALRAPPVHMLIRRLGAPALIVGVTVLVCAAVVETAEGPEAYPTYGDSVWWAAVTVTTVGYGDYVPVTPVGRSFALILMLTGVALLGTVAASLAAFLQELKQGRAAAARAEGRTLPAAEGGDPVDAATAEELRALRAAIDELRAEITDLRTPRA
jgi:voltage-gated potassium channel